MELRNVKPYTFDMGPNEISRLDIVAFRAFGEFERQSDIVYFGKTLAVLRDDLKPKLFGNYLLANALNKLHRKPLFSIVPVLQSFRVNDLIAAIRTSNELATVDEKFHEFGKLMCGLFLSLMHREVIEKIDDSIDGRPVVKKPKRYRFRDILNEERKKERKAQSVLN